MEATEFTDVCRLCPSTKDLIHVFDERLAARNNMKEVILVTTGIEILERDIVSKQICQRCCTITLKMFQFRQDALKQDRTLKEKCTQLLMDKGIRWPNTCVTIKKEKPDSYIPAKSIKKDPENDTASTCKKPKEEMHPSVKDVYRNFPTLKISKKVFRQHIAPVVSLTMGEVEDYFRQRKLDLRKFIFRPSIPKLVAINKVAKKKTTFPTKQFSTKKTVAPLKISKKLFQNSKHSDDSSSNNYVCTPVNKEKKKRKRSTSIHESEKKLKRKVSCEEEQSTSVVKSIGKTKPNDSSDSANTTSKSSNTTSKPGPASVKRNATISNPVFIISEPATSIEKHSKEVIEKSPKTNISLKEDRQKPKSSKVTLTDMQTKKVESNLPVRSATPPLVRSEPEIVEKHVPERLYDPPVTTSSKPEFIESLGLTPTVTATKSQTLHVCNLCGSVHNTAFELKRHNNRHMVCQFCKKRFKSLEAKQDHIDTSCEVKKIMNSPGPIVNLERVDFNLNFRKKYKEAFTGFGPILGLEPPAPVEQVNLREASPLPMPAIDDVIVLSDDEDTAPKAADPLSGTPNVLSSENVVYNTVSIVKPDVRIKNNTVLNNLNANLTDVQLIKDLIKLIKPTHPPVVEKMLQTDLPATKDIKVNNAEGTCEFKNLKDHLGIYKVPININSGPFHVAYQFKNTSLGKKKMHLWDNLPVTDISRNLTAVSVTVPQTPQNLPHRSVSNPSSSASVLGSSQSKGSTQSPKITLTAVSVVGGAPVVSPIVNTILSPSTTGVLIQNTTPSSHIVLNSLPQLINSSSLNTVVSNSATPLLQNYALSMSTTPTVTKTVPIPRSFVNTALNNSSSRIASSSGNTSIHGNVNSNSVGSLPPTKSPAQQTNSKTSTTPSSASKSTSTKTTPSVRTPNSSSLSLSTVKTNTSASKSTSSTPVSTSNNNTSISTSTANASVKNNSSESSRFRVKNVWELQ